MISVFTTEPFFMPVEEILWKRTKRELTNLMEKTSERYEKMKKDMGKKNGVPYPKEEHNPSNLEAQVRNMKMGGFPVTEGSPPA